MPILDFDRPVKTKSTAEWKKISADGAPPGVYTPNMSERDMRKWKAKKINWGKADARIEIQKTFSWDNGLRYPDRLGYSAQCKIVVSKQEPRVLMSCNGKCAMSAADAVEFQQALQEAFLLLEV